MLSPSLSPDVVLSEPVGLKEWSLVSHHQRHMGTCYKYTFLGPYFKASESETLGWNPEICVLTSPPLDSATCLSSNSDHILSPCEYTFPYSPLQGDCGFLPAPGELSTCRCGGCTLHWHLKTLKIYIFFNWRIIALQCCVVCCTTWISYRYT